MNEELVLIHTTFPDVGMARQFGTRLVELQVVGCVQLVPGVVSVYRWEGRTEEACEVLVLLKTLARHVGEVERLLREVHPYEVPEFVVVRMEVSESYRGWLEGL